MAVTACVALAIGCTSAPPMPSAGTQTPTPTPGAQASGPQPTLAPGQSAVAGTSATPSLPEGSPTPAPSGLPGELAVAGSLTVCTAQVGAPATMTNANGDLDGYNIEFANELASRLGLDPVIQVIDFSALISNVQMHACDVSIASQNITSDRSAQVDLIPYTQARDGFPVVVAINNPLRIRKLTDLCGQIVSAADGTTNVDVVKGTGDFVGQGLNDQCIAAKKPALTLKTFASEEDAVRALLDGTVVAYLGNSNFVAEYPYEIQTSTAVLPGTHQGLGVALDHPYLSAGIQAAVDAMISDGTYLQILRQYLPAQAVANFSIVEVPQPSMTPTPPPTDSPTPSATPAPSQTAAPSQSPTPSQTPTSSPTPTK